MGNSSVEPLPSSSDTSQVSQHLRIPAQILDQFILPSNESYQLRTARLTPGSVMLTLMRETEFHFIASFILQNSVFIIRVVIRTFQVMAIT
jgi:hypothetical protein